jgi:hypothetical protein
VKLQKLIGILMAAVILFSAAACTPKATPSPTAEPTATESPTETMEPTEIETETPEVLDTPETTVEPGSTANPADANPVDPNAAGQQPTAAGASNAPATSAGQPVSTAPDKYQYITQNLADGYQVRPNVSVTITWSIKNIGTTLWDKNYSLRYFAGPEVKNTFIPFPKTVAANAATDLTVTFTTPAQPGDYDLWFKLANAQSQNFGDLDFVFKVTNTPNNNVKPTAAPAAAPTAVSTP